MGEPLSLDAFLALPMPSGGPDTSIYLFHSTGTGCDWANLAQNYHLDEPHRFVSFQEHARAHQRQAAWILEQMTYTSQGAVDQHRHVAAATLAPLLQAECASLSANPGAGAAVDLFERLFPSFMLSLNDHRERGADSVESLFRQSPQAAGAMKPAERREAIRTNRLWTLHDPREGPASWQSATLGGLLEQVWHGHPTLVRQRALAALPASGVAVTSRPVPRL